MINPNHTNINMNHNQQSNYFNQQKGYLNQIALVQSECQPRKKTINIPATVFNRSPFRDRQNQINFSNTAGTPTRTNGKVSLSPLRSRKTDASFNTNKSNINLKSTTSRKKLQAECTNHPNKIARYMVDSQQQTLFYCQKCAILLASQGFKVSKMGDNNIQDHPRKREVDEFLNDLDILINNLLMKQNNSDNILKKGISQYQSQIQKIQSYYTQFQEVIDQHKRRVLEQIKVEFDTSSHNIKQLNKNFGQAISQSNSMKDDIHSSMNSIILEAQQSQYRPVMDLYKQKVRKYKQVLNRQIPQDEILVRKVCLKNGQQLCQTIAQGINIEWQDQKDDQQSNIEQSVNDKRELNPVECLQSQQKFAKSSLKEIGNLFCSFDQ